MIGMPVVLAAMLGSVPVMAYGFLLMGHVDVKIRLWGHLVVACGYLMQAAALSLYGQPVSAAIPAALAAWFLYEWFNGGGGDGLKRRLSKLSRFGPAAPRTA